MSIERDYLICPSYSFGGRDIRVIVRHDGLSYWTDRSAVGSILDDDFGQKSEQHTVIVPVPPGELRVIRDEMSPLFWDDEPYADEMLDAMLEPLFWQHAASFFGVSR